MVDIRSASQADLPSILEIYNEVIANSTAVYALSPSSLEERQAWFDARVRQGFPVLVAEDTTGVLGFASFGEFRGAWPGYRFSVEHTVHVRHDKRGRGLGSALVEALFPPAVDMGKHVMIGGVDAVNDASLRMHRRLGFEQVAHFREVGTSSAGGWTWFFCTAIPLGSTVPAGAAVCG